MQAFILCTGFSRSISLKDPIAAIELCGQSLLERHIRMLKACGVEHVACVVNRLDQFSDEQRSRLEQLGVRVRWRTWQDLQRQDDDNNADPSLAVCGHYLIEQRLLAWLLEAGGECVLVDSHPPASSRPQPGQPQAPRFAGAALISPSRLAAAASVNGTGGWCPGQLIDLRKIDVNEFPTFDSGLRRDRRGVWLELQTRDDVRTAEDKLIDGAQKGSLDLPAHVLHAPLENWAIRRLCRTSVTPNQLTLVTNIVAWTVTATILAGHYVTAFVLAALVGILDGLDGKLARLKLMTSRVGKLEHVFDMLFEYSWWFALGWALSGGATQAPLFLAGVALILCNFADTLAAAVFWLIKGRHYGRRLDNYTPFDLAVRKLSGRRNIYVWVILITALVSDITLGLWVAVGWGVITVLVRGGRAVMHLRDPRTQVDFGFVVD